MLAWLPTSHLYFCANHPLLLRAISPFQLIKLEQNARKLGTCTINCKLVAEKFICRNFIANIGAAVEYFKVCEYICMYIYMLSNSVCHTAFVVV